MVKRPVLRFVEVGPRDGLQNESACIPLEAKVRFIDALSATGLSSIEAGAFVSPGAVAQMADSDLVFENIRRKKGVLYSALVPNEQGMERALKAEVDKIAVFTAASETFNRKNINATILQSIERFKPVISRAQQAKLPVRAYISTAFHCPYEGKIAPDAVLALAKTLLELGVDELSVGDTIGKAVPDEVRALLERLLKLVPSDSVYMHFHNTYGAAVANALASWNEFGISGFDASAGGLGGCPYAPGASGNVATEDLAFAFEASGGKVPVSAERIVEAVSMLAPYLGHPLASSLSRVHGKPESKLKEARP